MEGRDYPVAARERLVVHVERAVGSDVHLDALHQPEAAEPFLKRIDLAVLRLEPPVAKVVRVVCDGQERVAAPLRLLCHLLDRVLAVRRPRRVAMEVPAQVAELDQRRQRPFARRLQLTEVLAQLRWDVLVAEKAIELFLAAGLEDLAGLDLLDAVLGDREPTPDRVLTQRDVVVLRAGEVLEEISVQTGRDDAEVEAQPVVRDHRRLRLAPGSDLLDPVKLREVVGQLARLSGRRDDVEVAEGLLAPPDASCLGDLQGRRMLTENRDDGLNRG